MKVKVIETTEVVKFKPITVAITIESKEEYDALKAMAWRNASIQQLFSGSNADYIEKFLTELHQSL